MVAIRLVRCEELFVEVNKQFFKYCILLQIDFQTHVFGCLNMRVWICSLTDIKGHPCDTNEASQLVDYLMHN